LLSLVVAVVQVIRVLVALAVCDQQLQQRVVAVV
jgi:hypothetical protein